MVLLKLRYLKNLNHAKKMFRAERVVSVRDEEARKPKSAKVNGFFRSESTMPPTLRVT